MTLANFDATLYRDYVFTRVIPAIKEFPSTHKHVILQQKNATRHGAITDKLLAHVSFDGWHFVLRREPPNSLDLNVLDLVLFSSIQALQYTPVSRMIDDVAQATFVTFDQQEVEKLQNVFLTYQDVMKLVLEHHEDNQFRLPRMGMDALRRAGTLMANASCPAALVI
ncbi:hypothetical protein H310_15202 [Aphanomyces invadans]|uniref:Uncharacterized protein n=1 Tax=Aphanomyces invadans TaxID=157072 RepID=A0A024T9G8_9STRA|nr:hypothetical protein H310_15202 [Aphanomyces invadans]ETV89957.1 hypothetical protein H310_15202 [Aphanomyces invadans]|eukprot:XP_008881409.1 hypothetical protein H310_15202 [Aphanomyces invadans]